MTDRRKTTEEARRPVLLGTNEIPPPMDIPWQMWSRSSDPHQQGLIVFEFTPDGLGVCWWEEQSLVNGRLSKAVIPWHEMAWMAGQQSPDLKSELDWIKERAQIDGYRIAREMVMQKVHSEICKLRSIAEETHNPFVAKYADGLNGVMDEVESEFKPQATRS
jgi:hypothetical protein